MSVADIRDILRTFCSVFHAAAYFGGGDLVLVGVAEGDVPEPRALTGAVRDALAALGAEDLAALRVAGHARLVAQAGDGPLLTDDALRLEFSTPQSMDNARLRECLRWVYDLWGEPPKPYGALLRAQELGAGVDPRRMWTELIRARKEAPDNRFMHRMIGETYLWEADGALREGSIDMAARRLELAKPFLRGDPRIDGCEADLAAARGDRADAARRYRALLERYPDSTYLRRRLARVTE
jgi:hypothetical protein